MWLRYLSCLILLPLHRIRSHQAGTRHFPLQETVWEAEWRVRPQTHMQYCWLCVSVTISWNKLPDWQKCIRIPKNKLNKTGQLGKNKTEPWRIVLYMGRKQNVLDRDPCFHLESHRSVLGSYLYVGMKLISPSMKSVKAFFVCLWMFSYTMENGNTSKFNLVKESNQNQ